MICNFVQSTSYHSAVKLRSIIKFSKRFFATLASNLIGYLSLYYTALPLFSLSAAPCLCSVWAELDEQAVNKVLRTVIWVLSKRDQAESSHDSSMWTLRIEIVEVSGCHRARCWEKRLKMGIYTEARAWKWAQVRKFGWMVVWMDGCRPKLKAQVWQIGGVKFNMCVQNKLLTSVDYIWTHRSL